MANLTHTMTHRRGRKVWLVYSITDSDGDHGDTLLVPAGVVRRPAKVVSVAAFVTSIATLLLSPDVRALGVRIDNGTSDLVACAARWDMLGLDQMWSCGHYEDANLILEEGFNLKINYQEVDTNVTPTADLRIMVCLEEIGDSQGRSVA